MVRCAALALALLGAAATSTDAERINCTVTGVYTCDAGATCCPTVQGPQRCAHGLCFVAQPQSAASLRCQRLTRHAPRQP